MRDPRLERLADVIVNYSVGVKRGQLVRISGPTLATPLISEIYRKVLAAGGNPFVRLNLEELEEIFYKTASEEQLKFLNPIGTTGYEKVDCTIGIWANENTKALSNVDPK